MAGDGGPVSGSGIAFWAVCYAPPPQALPRADCWLSYHLITFEADPAADRVELAATDVTGEGTWLQQSYSLSTQCFGHEAGSLRCTKPGAEFQLQTFGLLQLHQDDQGPADLVGWIVR